MMYALYIVCVFLFLFSSFFNISLMKREYDGANLYEVLMCWYIAITLLL